MPDETQTHPELGYKDALLAAVTVTDGLLLPDDVEVDYLFERGILRNERDYTDEYHSSLTAKGRAQVLAAVERAGAENDRGDAPYAAAVDAVREYLRSDPERCTPTCRIGCPCDGGMQDSATGAPDAAQEIVCIVLADYHPPVIDDPPGWSAR